MSINVFTYNSGTNLSAITIILNNQALQERTKSQKIGWISHRVKCWIWQGDEQLDKSRDYIFWFFLFHGETYPGIGLLVILRSQWGNRMTRSWVIGYFEACRKLRKSRSQTAGCARKLKRGGGGNGSDLRCSIWGPLWLGSLTKKLGPGKAVGEPLSGDKVFASAYATVQFQCYSSVDHQVGSVVRWVRQGSPQHHHLLKYHKYMRKFTCITTDKAASITTF